MMSSQPLKPYKEGIKTMATDQKKKGHPPPGKWADPSVPKKDWTCTDWYDLGDIAAVCEMCESEPIRFVHVMRHRDYHEELHCGCVCAGNMERNIPAAKKRDADGRNVAARRRRATAKGEAHIFDAAQNWLTAAKAVATGPMTDWERQFTTNIIKKLGRNYKFRMSDKQKGVLLGLFKQHRNQRSNMRAVPAYVPGAAPVQRPRASI
jgi:hypothetical protein